MITKTQRWTIYKDNERWDKEKELRLARLPQFFYAKRQIA